MRNVDSRIHSLRFDSCVFLFYSFSTVTFATQSARTHAPQQTTCMGCDDLFDHLVGAREKHRRHGQAECLRGLKIDYQLELGRGLDR